MIRKIFVWILTSMQLVIIPLADAQQTQRITRIGFLQRRAAPTPANPDPLAEAFLQGLREIGYVDGKNIKLEHRYADGQTDRLPGLIAEFATESRCHRRRKYPGDPRGQAGDKHDSHCDRDSR
jgi:hypothetical protein